MDADVCLSALVKTEHKSQEMDERVSLVLGDDDSHDQDEGDDFPFGFCEIKTN